MGYKRPESVLVLIYDPQDRVLVLQRKDDPDFWQSVTGTIELEELPIETAAREVHEETGIDIIGSGYELVDTRVINQFEIRPQWRYKYPPGEFTNTEYVFTVCVDSTTPIVLTEHLTHCWLSPAEAQQKVWSQSNKEAIENHFLNLC
ncbi:dihydroneopterin triphosphate diphosphatase [Planctobacterium marinum]|uniref:NUDIX pyrophosphatase n=1 Tax=Planctobacterium marinum TaxID=1631968 RepID=A0AA48HJ01_9ALTE|nr:NUDIX pyrophosphatase [Planctobacterium marinum]